MGTRCHDGTVNFGDRVMQYADDRLRTAPSYRGCRFPGEIISHCVWLYFRFCLSFRDVQEMMFERGVAVSHKAIRLWTLKFGAKCARRLRRCAGRHGDPWHLDEVFCKINGELVYLWRAVDQDGDTLEVLVQKRRNAKAARRFLRQLLKRLGYAPFPPASVSAACLSLSRDHGQAFQ